MARAMETASVSASMVTTSAGEASCAGHQGESPGSDRGGRWAGRAPTVLISVSVRPIQGVEQVGQPAADDHGDDHVGEFRRVDAWTEMPEASVTTPTAVTQGLMSTDLHEQLVDDFVERRAARDVDAEEVL